jgi:hypothetical protein
MILDELLKEPYKSYFAGASLIDAIINASTILNLGVVLVSRNA